MEKYFLEELGIEYSVKPSARARRVSIAVHQVHGVIITKPRRISLALLHTIVKENIAVIQKLQARLNKVERINTGSSREDYNKVKKEAVQLLAPRVELWATTMGINYSKVSVRYQISRWGSCSSTGTISLNYKLIKLPIHLQDYVIIHELAHRKEMNHSARFWSIVEKFDHDYKEHRKELQKYF